MPNEGQREYIADSLHTLGPKLPHGSVPGAVRYITGSSGSQTVARLQEKQRSLTQTRSVFDWNFKKKIVQLHSIKNVKFVRKNYLPLRMSH